MNLALHSLLNRCVRRGTLTFELPGGERVLAGDGSGKPLAVRLTDNRAARELLFNPELALGELYMDGRLVVTGGSIYDLLELLGRNLPNLSVPQIGALRHSLRAAFDRSGVSRPRPERHLRGLFAAVDERPGAAAR